MFEILLNILKKYHIDCVSALPLDACRVKKPYLLERCGIAEGSVVMLAVPYYTPACDTSERNLSAYAVARDYHLFFKDLFDELIPPLQEKFPKHKFVGFADHSPIDEIHAAASAGLGVIGKNGLLITPKYSSYVFLGALFTDMVLPSVTHEVQSCEGCGVCLKKCPSRDGVCLSSLTQKKGDLTKQEESLIRESQCVWGCDVCQEVCPHTERAKKSGSIFSPISFFSEATLPRLSSEALNDMSDEDFRARAYSWRGRETIERNLKLFEKGDSLC